MALCREGSESLQDWNNSSSATFRAHDNCGSRHDKSGSGSNRTPLKCYRGKKFGRVAKSKQCSIGVFVVIFFGLVGLTLLGSNYHGGEDKGEPVLLESKEFFDNQGHSTHYFFQNPKTQNFLLVANQNSRKEGNDELLERGSRRHGHTLVYGSGGWTSKVLGFGQGSTGSGQDSIYWDKDDRRRDEEYNEENFQISNTHIKPAFRQTNVGQAKGKNSITGNDFTSLVRDGVMEDKSGKNKKVAGHSVDRERDNNSTREPNGQEFETGSLYNERGRNELKIYEQQYEADLKEELRLNGTSKGDDVDGSDVAGYIKEGDATRHPLIEGRHDKSLQVQDHEQINVDDDYDDAIDEDDIRVTEVDSTINHQGIQDVPGIPKDRMQGYDRKDLLENQSNLPKEDSGDGKQKEKLETVRGSGFDKELSLFIGGVRQGFSAKETSELENAPPKMDTGKSNTQLPESKQLKPTKVPCEVAFLKSTVGLSEPKENPNFAKFSLQYVENEEKPEGVSGWEPRFAGHQSLVERENSFYARDQKLHCGFVKGPEGAKSTGFDLAEEDLKFFNTCHIAVSSGIFGNSDYLRTPPRKKVTQSSRKNVCFVMFVDEETLGAMSSDGRAPNEKGYIGLWKIAVVRNLPYRNMRRTGKVPKFLAHRLFPNARYSVWLDSKMQLQSDPLLILEHFLWNGSFEYAISNHYARHCVWEEVKQNKKLNKFNRTAIDDQLVFYKADGLTKFKESDSNNLLPSYVPEGSFIVRAHTPMSNLFSCLWFNEVDRFTPRDQLSFAYTFLKLRRMNPEKHFHLNMFKDCERRAMAKPFRHRNISSLLQV